MKLLLRFSPVLFLLFDCCIDPLSAELFSAKRKLVVEGMITDEAGPYTVDLFYTISLDSTLKNASTESGAQVWITSDAGESVLLPEISPGRYQTPVNSIYGTVGRSYALKIITKNGKEYFTTPQLMTPAGTIEELHGEFEEDAIALSVNADPLDAVNIYITARGTEGQPNLFRWRWTAIYKAKAFPELVTEGSKNGPIPDPLPCSGYVKQGLGIRKVAECTCCICWSYNYSSTAMISDSRYISGLQFNKVNVATVAATPMHFYDRYFITIEQLSVSKEAHEFWRLVQLQQQSSGSIFQPNSVRVKGNVHAAGGDEEVLGIFAVSAIVRKSIFIDRSSIPYELPPIEQIASDCRTYFPHSTTTKPSFW